MGGMGGHSFGGGHRGHGHGGGHGHGHPGFTFRFEWTNVFY